MKLIMVGDVMLGRSVNEKLKKVNSEYPWGNTLPILREANLRFCNLECAISNEGEPWDPETKAFHFRSQTKNVSVLKVAGIDAVALANNHSLDFGPMALKEMIHILNRNHIYYSGAGMVDSQAHRFNNLNSEDKTVGFISVTDNEPSWEATENRPGIYYVPVDITDPRATKLFKQLEDKKNLVDLLIVSIHWGPNWGSRPAQTDIRFAHALIDSGADIVYGHSPHVFRGVEFYRGRPILYSTGNFIDDYAVDEIEKNDESFIFKIEIEETGRCHLKLYPTVIRDCQVNLATGSKAFEIAEKMRKLCREFNTESVWNSSQKCLEVMGTIIS